MSSQNAVASTSSTNIVPVQAQFDSAGNCVGLIGPGGVLFTPPATNLSVSGTLSINGGTIISSTLPTIASGFGTGPVITAANTMGFKIVIGTGGATGGVIGLPTAVNGWILYASDVTNGSNVFIQQTASTANSATLAAFGNTTGTTATMSAGDVLLVIAISY